MTYRHRYASAICNPHQMCLTNALEAFQNRAIRFIHSAFLYTSKTSLKAESGLQALSNRRLIVSLSLFHKFYHSALNQAPYILPPSRISYGIGHPLNCPSSGTYCHLRIFFFPLSSQRLERPCARYCFYLKPCARDCFYLKPICLHGRKHITVYHVTQCSRCCIPCNPPLM